MLSSHICAAQNTTRLDQIISLDIDYLVTGLTNQGWGLGIKYEKSIFNYFSIKGGFGHMTFKTGLGNMYCTSVNLSLFIHFYPFGNGLDKLYFGIGNGCDFMNYFGDSEKMPEKSEDTIIFITPNIGYKWYLLKYIMLDFNIGYKIDIVSSNNYADIKKYIGLGFQFNAGFKLLLNG